ncbi:MAG TPA: hypothetical protein DCR65_00110 [Gammaproteobacteria bacterium]|nr:hypothetical protein [Gammaproteobacteria bacterium]
MRAPLSASVRRRILGDLGIEVWRLRSTQAESVARAQVIEPHTDRELARAAAPLASAPVAPAPSAAAAGPNSANTPHPAREPSAIPALRVEGYGLALPGAVLLLAGRPVGRDARFARDLLAAAAGSYAAEPELRRFEWPPALPLPGTQSPDAAQRALAAFLDKLLQDMGAKALLVEAAIAEMLPAAFADVLVVRFPNLSGLAREGAAKRAVWSSLQPLHAARPGAASLPVTPDP